MYRPFVPRIYAVLTLNANWVINFSPCSCSYALEMMVKMDMASDACVPSVPSLHSLDPDSKCPQLHNSSKTDAPLKFSKKQSIPKCYCLPCIHQLNNYLLNEALYVMPERGEVKTCLELIWVFQQKFTSGTYPTFLIFSSQPLFSKYQEDTQHGGKGLFSLWTYLFISSFLHKH